MDRTELAPWDQTPQPAEQPVRWWVWAMGGVAVLSLAVRFFPASVSTPAFRTTTATDIAMLQTALEAFKNDVGRYPTADEGLEALAHSVGRPGNQDGPYLRRGVPRDPWGRPYLYTPPAEPVPGELRSLGGDGKQQTADDIIDFIP